MYFADGIYTIYIVESMRQLLQHLMKTEQKNTQRIL